jgi:hypothetical protein
MRWCNSVGDHFFVARQQSVRSAVDDDGHFFREAVDAILVKGEEERESLKHKLIAQA